MMKYATEYNALPQSSGTFRVINISYNVKLKQMRIIEYDIDYIKWTIYNTVPLPWATADQAAIADK